MVGCFFWLLLFWGLGFFCGFGFGIFFFVGVCCFVFCCYGNNLFLFWIFCLGEGICDYSGMNDEGCFKNKLIRLIINLLD